MIVFKNSGVADIRALTTFGVNAKESGSNPIGIFGTGFKFAIAVLLRSEHSVIVMAGTTIYTFTARTDQIRGQDFQIVHMEYSRPAAAEERAGLDGENHVVTGGYDLAFTTALGRNWKMWQAYRELYCNSVTDEGGEVLEIGVMPVPEENTTYVIVSGAEFTQAHHDRDGFIISPYRKPRFVVPGVIEVYEGASVFAFYRGIRVGDLPEGGGRYTYNALSHMYLTEDRTLGWISQFTDLITQATMSGLDEAFSEDLMTISDEDGDRKGVESKLDFSGQTLTARVFAIAQRVILNTKRIASKSVGSLVVSYERENLLSRRVELNGDEPKILNNALADCRRVGLPWVHTVEAAADLGTGVQSTSSETAILLHIDLWKNYGALRRVLAEEIARASYNKEADDLRKFFIELVFKNMPLPKTLNEHVTDAAEIQPTVSTDADAAPGDSKVWVLTGIWSGYRSSQERVSHREIVSAAYAERLKNLHYIHFTDKTTLSLKVEETMLMDAAKFKQMLGYCDLIQEAADYGQSNFYVGAEGTAKVVTQAEAHADEALVTCSLTPTTAESDDEIPF